jgi:chromosome segregation ATPase
MQAERDALRRTLSELEAQLAAAQAERDVLRRTLDHLSEAWRYLSKNLG